MSRGRLFLCACVRARRRCCIGAVEAVRGARVQKRLRAPLVCVSGNDRQAAKHERTAASQSSLCGTPPPLARPRPGPPSRARKPRPWPWPAPCVCNKRIPRGRRSARICAAAPYCGVSARIAAYTCEHCAPKRWNWELVVAPGTALAGGECRRAWKSCKQFERSRVQSPQDARTLPTAQTISTRLHKSEPSFLVDFFHKEDAMQLLQKASLRAGAVARPSAVRR